MKFELNCQLLIGAERACIVIGQGPPLVFKIIDYSFALCVSHEIDSFAATQLGSQTDCEAVSTAFLGMSF